MSVLFYTTVLYLTRAKLCNSGCEIQCNSDPNVSRHFKIRLHPPVMLPKRHDGPSLCLTSACALTNRTPAQLLRTVGEVINLGISLAGRNAGSDDTNTAGLGREAEGKATQWGFGRNYLCAVIILSNGSQNYYFFIILCIFTEVKRNVKVKIQNLHRVVMSIVIQHLLKLIRLYLEEISDCGFLTELALGSCRTSTKSTLRNNTDLLDLYDKELSENNKFFCENKNVALYVHAPLIS